MKDYSEIVKEIRRNNEKLDKKLEEKERQALQKKQEEEERQRKLEEEKEQERKMKMQKVKEKIERKEALRREKVISYLLETIQAYQKLGKKVEKFTLSGSCKQEIEVVCKNVNDLENIDETVKQSISYEECFGAKNILQIHSAFGVRYISPLAEYSKEEEEKEIADGLLKVRVKLGDDLDFFVNY